MLYDKFGYLVLREKLEEFVNHSFTSLCIHKMERRIIKLHEIELRPAVHLSHSTLSVTLYDHCVQTYEMRAPKKHLVHFQNVVCWPKFMYVHISIKCFSIGAVLVHLCRNLHQPKRLHLRLFRPVLSLYIIQHKRRRPIGVGLSHQFSWVQISDPSFVGGLCGGWKHEKIARNRASESKSDFSRVVHRIRAHIRRDCYT
jgi:hypothetical protein